jgi:hypothetical protein
MAKAGLLDTDDQVDAIMSAWGVGDTKKGGYAEAMHEGIRKYKEEEQLKLVRTENERREKSQRRGSWFTVPKISWEDRAPVRDLPQSAALTSMSMDEQREHYDRARQSREADRRYRDLGGDGLPEMNRDKIKEDRFLLACNVNCVHCQHEIWFALCIEVAADGVAACRNCGQSLWPHGGFKEANIFRRLTGNFADFNAMLCHPPLDLHGQDDK